MKYFMDKKRHLVCKPFSIANLHTMAEDLELNRAWYHVGRHPHYDIPIRRMKEFRTKASMITPRDIYKIIHEGRVAGAAKPASLLKSAGRKTHQSSNL